MEAALFFYNDASKQTRMTNNKIQTVDEYIAGFPKDTQKVLQRVRKTIKKAAPGAEEIINYGIPTFTLHGNLVHYAGYKSHIGFYPTPSAIKAFEKELAVYKGAKGSVQFPLNEPMPLSLVTQMVEFRVQENLHKAEAKAKKKSLRTCPKGHQYYKTSDCPTCPVCEEERKPANSFLSVLAAPARRALEKEGITSLKQLSTLSENALLQLHGMGPGSLPKLRAALDAVGLSFKNPA